LVWLVGYACCALAPYQQGLNKGSEALTGQRVGNRQKPVKRFVASSKLTVPLSPPLAFVFRQERHPR